MKKHTRSVYIPDDQWEWLNKKSKELDMPISAIISTVLGAYIQYAEEV